MKQRPSRVVGIAVSKDDLALACRPEDTRWRVANDHAGIAQWLAQLRQLKPPLLVLDATGGWQGALVAARAVSKQPGAVMNPRHIRDVAKAGGAWAKTSALEAGVIAHVAAAVRPTRPLPAETTPQMDALLQRRRQRLDLLVAARHRVALACNAPHLSSDRELRAVARVVCPLTRPGRLVAHGCVHVMRVVGVDPRHESPGDGERTGPLMQPEAFRCQRAPRRGPRRFG